MTMSSYLVYTDGACIGNPGPGGWAAIIRQPDGSERTLTGNARLTTNNRMELRAALEALRSIPSGTDVHVLLRTDSRHLVDAITKGWAARWRKQGWRRNQRGRAENVDLWEQLLAELERRTVRLEWTKGHNGDPLNERCDQLARQQAEHATGTDEGYINRTVGEPQQSLPLSYHRTVECKRQSDGTITISDGAGQVTLAPTDVPSLVEQLVTLLLPK
jgi:ribonuclease HI